MITDPLCICLSYKTYVVGEKQRKGMCVKIYRFRTLIKTIRKLQKTY